MKGVGIGSMDIILKFTNGTKVTIWSRQGEQDTGWQREHVTIGPGSFKIWFQGSVNLPYGSDVAIDDVMLGCENKGKVSYKTMTLITHVNIAS